MTNGYIYIHRKIWECALWQDPEPFSKRDAWLDMLLLANYVEKTITVGSKTMVLPRGSFITNQSTLAARWRWGRQKVRDYLALLERLQMISTEATNKYTVVNMLKYAVYQKETTDEQPTKNQQKTNKKPTKNPQTVSLPIIDNKGNKGNKESIRAREAKTKFADTVKLTTKEFAQLAERLGEDVAKACVDILDGYKKQSGRKYKSDYDAILNWVIDAYYERQSRPQHPKTKNDVQAAAEKLEQYMEGGKDHGDNGAIDSNTIWDIRTS